MHFSMQLHICENFANSAESQLPKAPPTSERSERSEPPPVKAKRNRDTVDIFFKPDFFGMFYRFSPEESDYFFFIFTLFVGFK